MLVFFCAEFIKLEIIFDLFIPQPYIEDALNIVSINPFFFLSKSFFSDNILELQYLFAENFEILEHFASL